jgi:hypothetical protein
VPELATANPVPQKPKVTIAPIEPVAVPDTVPTIVPPAAPAKVPADTITTIVKNAFKKVQ